MIPLKCVLTPNRSDRPRYARLVTYQRDGAFAVFPLGVKVDASGARSQVVVLEWSQISETRAEPGTEADWRRHLAEESRRCTHPTPPLRELRAAKIAAGLIRPASASKWQRSLKRVVEVAP